MFIKVQDHDGESEDEDHKGWIDILSWSWGMSQSATTHIGGGGGQAQASVQDISFVKWVDKSTPALMYSCCVGKHIPKAEIHCTKASGNDKGGELQYIVIKMDDVIISSVSTGGSGGEDRLTENVSLNFAKVEYQYTVQTAQGGAGAKPKVTWDVKAGRGSVS
jgi:type VI secretion system secreted protein Hcp